jgi:dual specificity tyrosine-phosphorylation-regulated kinase 2/3/4
MLASCEDETFLDFVEGCLEWDPEQRLTPEEALMHDWVQKALIEAQQESEKQKQMEEEGKAPVEQTETSRNRAGTAETDG